MTFCLGMKVEKGLVGIADTRITSGAECITRASLPFSITPAILYL